MRKRLVAGNWKMNPASSVDAEALADGLKTELEKIEGEHDVDVLVCPPTIFIADAIYYLDDLGVLVGAQNCWHQYEGAYTGETSPTVLAEVCSHVILGHSERREFMGESDALIGKKVAAALTAEITPILCIGESLEIRKSGNYLGYILGQLTAALDGIELPADLVIAYEPIWAIGTGESASAEQAEEVICAIRAKLSELGGEDWAESVQILYGGSTKPDNLAEYLAMPDIDGALVGGSSLNAKDFAEMVKIALT